MPRPRKDDPQCAATAKIEAAFWQLLEEVGYDEITVRRVSQTSGTNRNSFYYHYECLEDLARKAFQDNAEGARPLVSSLLAGLQSDIGPGVRIDSSMVTHAERVMLCARSESPFLRRLVQELLREAWFAELGIDESSLTEDDHIQCDFIFAGLVSVLGGGVVAKSPQIMPDSRPVLWGRLPSQRCAPSLDDSQKAPTTSQSPDPSRRRSCLTRQHAGIGSDKKGLLTYLFCSSAQSQRKSGWPGCSLPKMPIWTVSSSGTVSISPAKRSSVM